MQIYFHSRLWSYLPRVPILVEGTLLHCLVFSFVCVAGGLSNPGLGSVHLTSNNSIW